MSKIWKTVGLIGFVFVLLFSGVCVAASNSAGVELAKGKWLPDVKANLEVLIVENAGKGKKVIFDFDNTLLSRDIGEATFSAMIGEGKLTVEGMPKDISPSFTLDGKRKELKDVKVYYETFLSATGHQPGETSIYSNGYAWLAQSMAGMTPADIVSFTEKAYANGIAINDLGNKELQETKINGYRQPFFYPEMVDLAGLFLKNGYDVYVLSASNVWTVRWMVTNQLNPMIQAKHGKNLMIAPDHVIAVATLIEDKRDGQLYKDPLLVKTNKAYADSDMAELANYTLTTQIVYPLSGYFGKVANIMKFITSERPFFIAGDSPNDHPMLNWAENRLWITRLEKMGYQEKTINQINKSLPGKWFLQPALYKKSPGFVSSQKDLDERFSSNPAKKTKMDAVVKFLKESGKIEKF